MENPIMMHRFNYYESQGRKFSVEGLLGTSVSSTQFSGGSLVIFRLAPQVLHDTDVLLNQSNVQ